MRNEDHKFNNNVNSLQKFCYEHLLLSFEYSDLLV